MMWGRIVRKQQLGSKKVTTQQMDTPTSRDSTYHAESETVEPSAEIEP